MKPNFVCTEQPGFTLIELMIVVAIIAILVSIAVPAYTDYVLRGQLTEAFNLLADTRVRMEQFYQDNNRYASAAGGTICGVATMPTGKFFTLSCAATDSSGSQAFTLAATGKGPTAGFVYTVNDRNKRATTTTKWGISSTECWIAKRSGDCY